MKTCMYIYIYKNKYIRIYIHLHAIPCAERNSQEVLNCSARATIPELHQPKKPLKPSTTMVKRH